MAGFYDNVGWETARNLDALARLSLELREARAGVLRHHGIAHQDELRARIADGTEPEHPAYEHVLAMRILDDTREAVRGLIAAGGSPLSALATPHLALREMVEREYASELEGAPALSQDALLLRLRNGVALVVHCAAPDDYSLRWDVAGEDGVRHEAGIDTAPRADAAVLGGSHLHCADGRVVADPVTRPGAAPEANLRALLDVLRANPRFGRED